MNNYAYNNNKSIIMLTQYLQQIQLHFNLIMLTLHKSNNERFHGHLI